MANPLPTWPVVAYERARNQFDLFAVRARSDRRSGSGVIRTDHELAVSAHRELRPMSTAGMGPTGSDG